MEIETKNREFRFQGRLFTLPEVLIFNTGKLYNTGEYFFYKATAFRKPMKGDFFVSNVTFAAVATQARKNLDVRRIIVERRAKAVVKGYWVEDVT